MPSRWPRDVPRSSAALDHFDLRGAVALGARESCRPATLPSSTYPLGIRVRLHLLIYLERWPSFLSPIGPTGPSEGWASDLTSANSAASGTSNWARHRSVCVRHHERLVRSLLPAFLDSLELVARSTGRYPPGRMRPLSRPASESRPLVTAPEPRVQHTLVPSRSASRATQMSRPSSTSRLPAGCGSPNRGSIDQSGVNRSAACSAARLLARMVLPDPGRPTIGIASPSQCGAQLMPEPPAFLGRRGCREVRRVLSSVT